jgi:hypothetical protein
MRIDNPQVSKFEFQAGAVVADSNFTGSFTGSFVGDATGASYTAPVLSSAAQGQAKLTTNGVAASAVDLGLQTDDSPQFTGIELGHATDTTVTRVSAGVLAVEGTTVQLHLSEGGFADGDKTKLDAIEDAATADQTKTDINGLAITTVGTINSGVWNGTAIAHAYIGADAIEGDNLADNAVDSEHYTDGSIATAHIADDQVTYAKVQNVSATNRILGRDSDGEGVIEEITPVNIRTMINVENGADVTDTANVKTALNASFGGAVTIGNSSDTVTIPGNFTVSGTTVSINATNLNVEDKLIAVASGSANSAAADGAGLFVSGAAASITYSHSGTKWNLNKPLDVTGNITLTGTVDGIDIGTDVAANTLKTSDINHNITTNLSEGTSTTTTVDVNSSDGTNATLASASTTRAGLLTKAKFDEIAANTLKATDVNHNVTTNLSKSVTTTNVTINSSDGAGIAIGAATTTTAGVMTKTLFDKLNGIEASAKADQTLGDLNLDTGDDVRFDSFGVGTAASGTTGEIRATGDITAYYSSDERLKENFAPLAGALDKVNQIGGYEFDWKEGIEEIVSKEGHDIGVKAQEVQAVYPELVHERDNGYLAVDYVKLTAVLIEAVKELSAKVDKCNCN